ncbi:MAG: proliferating cell nuclear antigen (pcna) [Candidatus Aenigmatarchaeota archaeon]
MFKASLSDPSLLKDSIDTISKLIHEGIFEADEESLSLKAADRSTVAVVDFELKADAFEEYECDEKKELGVNIENFIQILKRAKGSDTLGFELSEDESQLIITIENDTKREFAMPLLSISSGEIPDTEQLEFPVEVEMKSSLIDKTVSDAEIISDSVVFKGEEGLLTMEAEGDSSSVKIETEAEKLVDMKVDEETRSRYPIDYLKKMIKAAKISDVVSVRFGNDYPMKLEFSEPEKIRLSFVLAPRVEE